MRRAVVLVLGIGFATAVVLSVRPARVTFNVTAESESLRFRTSRPQSWGFRNATVAFGSSSDIVTGIVALQPEVDVTVVRQGGGPLRIHCRQREGASVGYLQLEEGEEVDLRTLPDEIVIRLDNLDDRFSAGEGLVLPFAGHVYGLSSPVSEYSWTAPLLRRGRVDILVERGLGGGVFGAGSVDLSLGDDIRTTDGVEALGIVAFTGDPGLGVVLRLLAGQCFVDRFAVQGFTVTVDTWTRVVNDPSLRLVWMTFLFFLGLGTGVLKWREEHGLPGTKA